MPPVPAASDRIYLSPPHMGPRERELLLDAFDSNWVAPLGPHVDAFESEFATFTGVPHAAALSSGTGGLHLALELCGVRPGDEVFVPTFTFVATANAVGYRGAIPVLIDASPDSWNLDTDLVAAELDRRAATGTLPKAVISVDLYGQCADYDPLLAACERHGVPLIEDAAEALGATYKGVHSGGFGRLGVFSFNGNKIMTTSGGGMLVSHDGDLVDRSRFLATQARETAPHYQHEVAGNNYRMSNLLAAVGRGQLEALPPKVERRRAINRAYRASLADIPGLGFLPDAPTGSPTNWLTVITLDPTLAPTDPTSLRVHLETHNIEARPAWKPMHLQPLYAHVPAVGGEVAAGLFATGLCLPSGSSLTDADQDRVVSAMREVLHP